MFYLPPPSAKRLLFPSIHQTTALDIPLFLALWFHNVTCLETNLAVNVFWKDLPDSFYDTRDAYGNKDLVPYQRAQQGNHVFSGTFSSRKVDRLTEDSKREGRRDY